MKKFIAILFAILMTASLCACGIHISLPQGADGNIDIHITQPPEEAPDGDLTADDLVGPWYLDGKNNDLDKISELFSGYGEWGATMEIRSDGKISWYIGAIGGSGAYTLDGEHLTAELKQATKDETSAPQDWTIDFNITATDGDVMLTMPYEDTTVVWSHGEASDSDTEDWKTDFEASLLEQYGVTPDRYEDLGDGVYQVYVTINGESVPYVTVDSATGDYHG